MKIMIIGAEATGASAAAKAKRLLPEAEIIIYEKSDVTSFGACGLPYFIANCFEDTGYMVSRTVPQFAKSGITVKIRHEVKAVDPAAKTAVVEDLETGERSTEPYDRLMIAAGASPVIPPIENLSLKHVFTLKTMDDGIALKQAVQSADIKSVAVVGAGFIGLEVTDAMMRLGKKVRLFQLEDRVISDAFDKEITDVLEKELTSAGVDLHLAETVRALKGTAQVTGVITDKGEYPADLVIFAVGVKPNTAFLQDTGMAMLKNGAIIIDKKGRTSLTDIYAAGDCATVPHFLTAANVYIPLATTANKLGKIAGENLVSKESEFPGTLGSAAVKMLKVEAGRTGLTEKDALKAGISWGSVFVRDKNHSNYLPGQSDIFVKLIYHKETGKLLGGQVAGRYGAALRANVLATAVWNGMTVEELGMLDLFYAPPFSRPWDVLNIAANAVK